MVAGDKTADEQRYTQRGPDRSMTRTNEDVAPDPERDVTIAYIAAYCGMWIRRVKQSTGEGCLSRMIASRRPYLLFEADSCLIGSGEQPPRIARRVRNPILRRAKNTDACPLATRR